MRRPRAAFLLTALIAAASLARTAPAAGQTNGLRPRDLHRLRSVEDVRLSPDGRRVAYTVASREAPGRPSSEVWIMDLATKAARRLREDGGSASGPRWSPDGRRLAFLGSHGDAFGLMVVRIDDRPGEPVFLAPVRGTNHPLPSAGERLSWSPDGRRIAFLSATPGPEAEAASGDPVVITRYLYKPTKSEGLTRFNDNRRLHIFVADVDGGEVRQLTHGDAYEHSIDWSPRGDEIVFVSNREPDPDRFFNYDLFTVRVADGAIRRLTHTENAEYHPRWSPDGRTIAYLGTRRGLTSSETTMEDTHLWLVDADGGNRRELGAGIDNRQGAPAWSPDGSRIYFTVLERGTVRLYAIPATGGRAEVVVGDRGRVRSWSVARDGRIAYAFHAPDDLPQLHLRTRRGTERLTRLNAEALAGREIAPIEAFTFRSFDGTEVEAFLTLPLGRTADSRHPLITMIHGGPHGQQGPVFDYQAQVYASRGWAVLMVNYRGSTGYGQAFADAIFGDQNGGEAKDVLYGVQAALRRHPWIDPERLGIQGGSYGGQLTNWLITQTDRFAAAIPIASISNLISFNYMAYYHDYLAVEFGAFPHQEDLMDVLWQRSPLKHVARVRTPTMLVHGENDNDVPIAEAEQFYIALKDVGVETIMLRYPREGHGIREVGHAVDLAERSIAWYERHFDAGGAGAATDRDR